MRKSIDGSLIYTKEERIKLLDDILGNLGYIRDDNEENFNRRPTWYKLYDHMPQENFIWVNLIIDLDLTASVQPIADCDGILVKSYDYDLKGEPSDMEEFIKLLRRMRKDGERDVTEAHSQLTAKLNAIQKSL